MKNLINLFKILAVATALFSCKKEVPSTPCSPSTPVVEQINSSIGGLVIDENNVAVSGARVTLGSHSTTTNVYGVFLFNNVQMNKTNAFVKVEKSNYFLGGRTIDPGENKVENVNIKLIPKTISGTFNSTSGGIITSSGGVKINFQANSIENENGNSYSGQVQVAIKHIDPNLTDFHDISPGRSIGKDVNGDEKYLETFGKVAVELTGTAGEKLNLISGNTAQLTVPLSGVTAVSPPSTISLWSFNETTGIWDEEGSAILNGNEFHGNVSHFSFWDLSTGTNFVQISGKVICNSLAFANAKVELSYSSGGGGVGIGFTNSDGEYSGRVPMNTTFAVKVFSRFSCSSNNPLYTGTVTITNASYIMSDISACMNNIIGGSLSVKLVDCSSSPVTNGFLKITLPGQNPSTYFPDANGFVHTQLMYCSQATMDIIGYDFTNSKTSAVRTENTVSTMILSDILICTVVDEYIHYTLDGTNYSIFNNFLTYPTTNGHTFISGNENNNRFEIYTRGISTGTFLITDSLSVNQYYGDWDGPSNVTINYTTYGISSGSYVEGTFSGNFDDYALINHTLSGSFRIKI